MSSTWFKYFRGFALCPIFAGCICSVGYLKAFWVNLFLFSVLIILVHVWIRRLMLVSFELLWCTIVLSCSSLVGSLVECLHWLELIYFCWFGLFKHCFIMCCYYVTIVIVIIFYYCIYYIYYFLYIIITIGIVLLLLMRLFYCCNVVI